METPAVSSQQIVQTEEAIELSAVRLLEQGQSIRAVAESTGLSRRQVTKLKAKLNKEDCGPFGEVDHPFISQQQAVAKTLALSVRPEGVKRSELWAILKARFGLVKNELTGAFELGMTKHQYRYLKESVRAAGQAEVTPLFVPEWMPRHDALEANRELLRAASDLQDVMTEKVLEFCSRFPGTSFKWVFQELLNLAAPGVYPGSVEALCERNLEVAEELSRRVGRRVVQEVKPVFTSDAELEALCV
ncbi:hypothetical protein AABC73_02005 [Pseudomonas sp. G.S.17]|uniref:helix-turn-helix domain-containing protein n=1 Tax=Pseudomonas sp. G.S.17 TaxID=3137451 RepID=UPI00311CCF96